MDDLKIGETVKISMGATVRSVMPDRVEVLWHNTADFTSQVPLTAIHGVIAPGSVTERSRLLVGATPKRGDTVKIEMGAEILRPVNETTLEVRWHNGSFVGLAPVHAMNKVLPGRSASGMPRRLVPSAALMAGDAR